MKRFCILLSCTLVLLLLSGCGALELILDEIPEGDESPTGASAPTAAPSGASLEPLSGEGTQWAMYWYLCGSDLESEDGAATRDIEEMLSVQLPEGVQVIIQTGGAEYWHNDFVDPNYIERYIYDHEGLRFLESQPLSNMGEADTLSDFLRFASEQYPAEYSLLNLWNHGGGALGGVAFDELYDDDALSMEELSAAFSAVYGQSPEQKPFDIIGFDACLMADLSTAHTVAPFGHYMVASQESEPEEGWYYSGMFESLAQNRQMDPLDFSIAICDSYVEGCTIAGSESDITLSVLDLAVIPALGEAYEAFGLSALSGALDDPQSFDSSGAVDMGQMLTQVQQLLPEESAEVLAQLEAAVLYEIGGPFSGDGMGLSTYYEPQGARGDIEDFITLSPAPSMGYLYLYGQKGELSAEGMAYLEQALSHEGPLPQVPEASDFLARFQDYPIEIDRNGSAVLEIGPEAEDLLSAVSFELYYSPDDTLLYALGTGDELRADWERGVFLDNFFGEWLHINGALCYMELMHVGEGYSEFAVPILLNGEARSLSIVRREGERGYSLTGVHEALSEGGAAARVDSHLLAGDIIEPIHYEGALYSEQAFDPVLGDAVIVGEALVIEEAFLPDGDYYFLFRMEDGRGNTALSELVNFEIIRGEIYTNR